MARPFPYTYISCPCAETPTPDPSAKRTSRDLSSKKNAGQLAASESEEEGDEQAFDPRSPRANFSLYPPEQLLFCEDCHQIKCPRCITEEIVCWYCPNCLFETPSSMVRSEGNRCARNCFTCPVCTAPLAVTTLENTTESHAHQGPWILACGYCMWTTLDIGLKFDKPTNIRIQLSKMYESANGRKASKTVSGLKSSLSTLSSMSEQLPGLDEEGDDGSRNPKEQSQLDHNARFAALKTFYRNQIAETSASPTDPLGSDFGAIFSSPSALNRIMSIYTSSTLGGPYGAAAKKQKSKLPVMREALTASEGLKIPPPDAERFIIERITSPDCGWDGLASMDQRAFQSPDARFVDDLRPLPVLLRTKRSKRCKSCKHILVKPEFKPQSTRFRIRLIALSYIPLSTLRPLVPSPYPGQLPSSTSSPSISAPSLDALEPSKPIQFLLTLKNHLFDPVNVTLATPSLTPGRVTSKITILCPQFELGANSDVWDEALQNATATADRSSRSGSGFEKVAEAGKVWDKGRNWTTVVLEVVPGTLPGSFPRPILQLGGKKVDDARETSDKWENTSPLREDEDVLEIPIFVRLEWDSENQMIEQPVGKGQKPETIKRELAYWMVLGAGRIKSEDASL
ncbi:Dynactin p62 family domain containing protein [Elaphomyces granulatus]